MLKRLISAAAGIVLVVSSLWGGCVKYQESTSRREAAVLSELEKLPDHDYIADIRNLMAAKRYGEAKILCEDVISGNFGDIAEAEILQKECEKHLSGISSRISKAAKGFIIGNPDSSIEEIGGTIASDMLMYGDVRDLIRQGWFKISGKETDGVIVALAGIGLVTELADAVDWLPAVLKAFRKGGVMTAELADLITGASVKMLKQLRVDDAAARLFTGLGDLVNHGGFIRSKKIFASLKNCDDVTAAAKYMKKSPAVTHLVSRHFPSDAVQIISETEKLPGAAVLLNKAVRKGTAGIRIVARAGKVWHKGLADGMVRALIRASGNWFYAAALVMLVSGAGLIVYAVKPVGKLLLTAKQKASST